MSGWNYNWILEFEDGSRLSRTENNRFQRDKRIDPNNPGKIVKSIRLEPIDKNLPVLAVAIPKGSMPVVHRHTAQPLGGIGVINYRIGWQHNNCRVMISVNPETNLVVQEMDVLQ